jgi:hypothetical protein
VLLHSLFERHHDDALVCDVAMDDVRALLHDQRRMLFVAEVVPHQGRVQAFVAARLQRVEVETAQGRGPEA